MAHLFRDFKTTFDPILGNCFTYNFNLSNLKTSYRAGANHGLRVLLQASQDDYVCTSLSAGFKIVIHDAAQKPFPDAGGFIVAPGTATDIAMHKVKKK